MTLYTRSPARAAAVLRNGGTVAFPTETVYGLGADALHARAVAGIFRAKGRPADNPLIVHLCDRDQLGLVARRVPRSAERLLDRFAPGPVSVIVPRSRAVPDRVTAGLDTVAVRFPGHAVARRFLEACGCPVAAPSANRSGRPSPTTWQAVRDDLDGRADAVLTVGRIAHGIESTVVDCTGPRPVLLRAGSLSLEALREVVPGLRVADRSAGSTARSPGTKYRHYAPRAPVRLVTHPGEITPADADRAAYLGLTPPPRNLRFRFCRTFRSAEAYARDLFRLFRESDAAGVRAIFCQTVPPEGIGLALADRLVRAAAGRPRTASGSGRSRD